MKKIKIKKVKPNIDKFARTLPAKSKRSHKIILSIENVDKSFNLGGKKVQILKDIDLKFYSGEFAIIFGPSGCGKSTLLHVMLGLEPPDHGKVFLRDKSLYHLDEDERTCWRREKVGMVFQQSNWIKSLNVIENVSYPLYLTDTPVEKAQKKAKELLAMLKMDKAFDQTPTELSGGEQQRVALARALITNPGILICDEPTGNLDSKSSLILMKLLTKLNRKESKAIIMVTHEGDFLTLANRRVMMKDGVIIGDEHD